MKQDLFWLRTSTMADAREMVAKYKRKIFRYPQLAEGNSSKNTYVHRNISPREI